MDDWDGWENDDIIVPTLLVPGCTIKGCVDFSRWFTKCVICNSLHQLMPTISSIVL